MEKLYVYIDEFGNPFLNEEKGNAFSHYVYTAIVFKESEKEALIQAMDFISRKYFKGAIIKLSNDKKGLLLRKNILNDLKKLNFMVVSLVINKAELKGEGLRYKKVFYKFFHRIFVEKLASNFNAFEICADKIQDTVFQRELRDYIETNGTQIDLFNPERYFRMVGEGTESTLLELTNILADFVGAIYCISHQVGNADELFELLSDRLYVEFFPLTYKTYLADTEEVDKRNDREISRIALEGIIDFVERYENLPKYIEHIEILKYLLLIFRSNPNKLVSTKELISVVKNKVVSYSQDNLRQDIAYMRDRNLIITSPQGKYGYKIPNSIVDMVEFYNRYFSSIKPMLRRIQKSNDLISLRTLNKVNILKQVPEFNVLKELIAIVQKYNIGE